MDYHDYYKTLGVARDADEKAIRKAYRDLARRFHPDMNPGDKTAEAKFKDINEAYEVLSDADKRAKYDQLGASYQQYARSGANPGGFDWTSWAANSQGQPYGGSGGFDGSGDFSDFFSTIFGFGGGNARTRQQTRQPIRGRDAEQPIEVTLEEVYSGTTRTIKRGEKQTKIRIPAGAQDGTRIRVPGQGELGVAGGPPGDLFLVVARRPHSLFKTRENQTDLNLDQKIDLYSAVLGGEVLVPTLSGDVKLRIAEGTQSGQWLRISKRGLPDLRTPEMFGDLYVRVLVQVPTNLTADERDLFERLAALRAGS
ncbi:MAG: DnaJ C-terminal domain-containing protein [Aggregatilineales bacterium]